MRQGNELEGFKIEGVNLPDCRAYFLSVGSDILYRRCAHQPRNSCETLHAGEAHSAGVEDKFVPAASCADMEDEFVVELGGIDFAREGYSDYQSGKPFVRHEQIGAATQDEGWDGIGAGKVKRLAQVGLRGNGGEVAGAATDAEGGVGGQRVVLFDLHSDEGYGKSFRDEVAVGAAGVKFGVPVEWSGRSW